MFIGNFRISKGKPGIRYIPAKWCGENRPELADLFTFMQDYIPVNSSISFSECCPVLYSFTAFLTCSEFLRGLPPTRPLARAAFNPSRVLSAMQSRSNCVIADINVKSNFPVGVVVSIDSFSEIMATSRLLNNSTSSIKSLVEAPLPQTDNESPPFGSYVPLSPATREPRCGLPNRAT